MKILRNTALCAGMALGMLISGSLMAQAPQTGQPERGKTALTEQQRTELQQARLEQQKKQTETQLLLAEKKARLNTLQAAEKPNLREINSVIDEIAALQAEQMKARAALDVTIRGMLTPEQRIAYDAARVKGPRTEGTSRTQRQRPFNMQMQRPGQGRSQMQGRQGQMQGRAQMQGRMGQMRTPATQPEAGQ